MGYSKAWGEVENLVALSLNIWWLMKFGAPYLSPGEWNQGEES